MMMPNYGDWLNELSHAARKVGVRWVSLAEAARAFGSDDLIPFSEGRVEDGDV